MARLLALVSITIFLVATAACGDSSDTDTSTPTATTVSIAPTATSISQSPLTSTPEPTPVPVPTPTVAPPKASFWPDLCRIEEPPGIVVHCGSLIVPENRSDPQTRMIELHVAVFRSTSDNPSPDPVVYLSGGPGGSAVETAPFQFPVLIEPFLRERDVVIFDQRGTGFSEPALDCPEDAQVILDNLDEFLSLQEQAARRVEAMHRCKERLIDEGIDLSAYNTIENAADLNDLRVQLGIGEWNIYGVSYGSRLALATMREHPEGIRSVILDSTLPFDVDLYASLVPNADRALAKLFVACEVSTSCNRAYPDLESKFYAVAAMLDESPGRTTVLNPLTGQTREVVITGDRLVGTVFDALYVSDFIPLLPELIDDASNQEFRRFAFMFGVILAQLDFFSTGMQFSVQCAEELPFTSRERVALAADSYPELAPYIESESAFDVCDAWGADTERTLKSIPMESDVPTLILAGEFDPITPPEWGRMVNSTLANSSFFEFPSVGHGVITSSECSFGMALAFLRRPTEEPDGSCIGKIGPPAFTTTAPERMTLVPFEDPTFSLRGVVPEGWLNLGPGVFSQTSLGLVAIVQQAVATNFAAQLLPTFSQQFGIAIPPEPDEGLEFDGLGWSIYRLRALDQPVDVAISDDDRGVTYFVIMTPNPDDGDAMYRSIFLPALDALEVIRPQ